MVKGLMTLVLILFLLPNISASCGENGIDINTANLTELDKIKWVGPSTAQNIINYRQNNPFNSVDELLNVSGIGPTKLFDITTEGLACVNENAEETHEQPPEENEAINETQEEATNSNLTTQNTAGNTSRIASNSKTPAINPTAKAITLETIDLNSKDIKSENNNENLGKNLALGGITTFCLLFGTLFFLKFARRKTENEFR